MITNEVIMQIYRGGIPGGSDSIRRDKLVRGVAQLKQELDSDSVCFHGFSRELVNAWDRLAALASNNGMQALASWGLDGEQDNDGSRLTGKEKGECIGSVLMRATCAAGLIDAEGRWDSNIGADDVTNESNALAMGEALRAAAPNALVGDQCWFAIDSHGDVRTVPLVAEPQNVFRGFPVDEFARKAVNWFQFRQMYCNEAGFKAQWGRTRYEKVRAWMERDWNLIAPAFKRVGLYYNPGITLQAYGWDDCISDLMHCLISFNGEKQQPVIMWCDWYPSPVVIACVRGLEFLKANGYVITGRDAVTAVKLYQSAFNKHAPMNAQLDADGACGEKTLASMGIRIGQ